MAIDFELQRVVTGPDGFEVYHWPEFKALMDKLGVPWHTRTKSICVTLLSDCTPVVVIQTYAELR